MYSCDKVMVAQIFPNITYEKITLCGGIANNIREFTYANEKIYAPDGRGYIDYVQFLKKIGIEFEEVTLEELYTMRDTTNLMLLTSKSFLDNLDRIKKATQICLIYSAFKIKRLSEESIELSIADKKINYRKTITFEDLADLFDVHTKPLNHAIKIIKFKDKESIIDDERIRNMLKQQLENFLVDQTRRFEETICWSGPQMYKKSCEIITSLIENKEERYKTIKIFQFVGTLNAGGDAFYRKDFEKALKSGVLKIKKVEVLCELLHQATSRWYEICRRLRKIQGKNDIILNVRELDKLFIETGKIELDAVEKILKEL